MRQNISRSYSDKFLAGSGDYDLFKNKNVEWMNGPFVKIVYLATILFLYFMIHISTFFSAEDCWTVTNMIHGVVTFFMLHWIKGCPDDSTQGEYNALTLYEQIDAGTPWTATKKFLILVPTFLCLIACFTANYKPFYIVVNCGIMLICVIGKFPQMHRVRIFGINSTPGIDQPIEYTPDRSETKKGKGKSKKGN